MRDNFIAGDKGNMNYSMKCQTKGFVISNYIIKSAKTLRYYNGIS